MLKKSLVHRCKEGEEDNDGRHIDYFERMVGSDEYLEHLEKFAAEFPEFWEVFK